MKLTHTRKDGLTGIFILAHSQGWIFSQEFFQNRINLFLVSMGFGLYRHRDNGLINLNFFQQNRMIEVAQRFARG